MLNIIGIIAFIITGKQPVS